jgi:hypothetical protein
MIDWKSILSFLKLPRLYNKYNFTSQIVLILTLYSLILII